MSKIPAAPQGYNTVNPFIITNEADEMIKFAKAVFHATDSPDALTYDADGLILHSEIKIGNSVIAIADRKPDWPFTPSLLQVYVDDIDATLTLAKKHGATVVTKPTEFLGTKFARFTDPHNNLWWIYQYLGEPAWGPNDNEESSESWEPTKEAIYIHDTLLQAMRELNKN